METSQELVLSSNLDDLARLGTWLAFSESGDKSPKALGASAALRLYYCQQLNLPPFAASQLSVINGNLFVGADLYRAMAIRDGYQIKRVDSTDETCTAVLTRDGVEVGRATFTMAMATKAGLANKTNWKTHPDRMLWARASKYVIQDFAPHVALGIALDDEISEYTKTNPADNGVTVTSTFIAPTDVVARNEQQVEEELAKHADLVEGDE